MASLSSPEGLRFRKFLETLIPYKIKAWGATYREEIADCEEIVLDLNDADVVSSALSSSLGQRHVVAIDIDHPAWLVRSSTPEHYHLYIDVPGGIDWETYEQMLYWMAQAGVIEKGYHEVSKKRKRTDLRLPWVKKQGQ
jgi:hypothetical protein